MGRPRDPTSPRPRSNASFGCGVPTAVADLHEGETVLDLGSGAGADVLISARRVGPTGKVIGLDMTDEMLELARANARDAGVENVEFVKGYLERHPAPGRERRRRDLQLRDQPLRRQADRAARGREGPAAGRPVRRLRRDRRPGHGRATKADMAAWTGCIAGALTEDEFRARCRGGPRGSRDPRDPPGPRTRRRGDYPRLQALVMTVLRDRLTIRPAENRDLKSVVEIYNVGIAERVATFETEPRTIEDISGSTERWPAVHRRDRQRAGRRLGTGQRLLRPVRLPGRRRARGIRRPDRPRARTRTHTTHRAVRRIGTTRAIQTDQPRVRRKRAEPRRAPRRRVRRGRHPAPPRQARQTMEGLRRRRASARAHGGLTR